MKITVFGSGYVGLVAAAGFADAGHKVHCIDIDEARISRLRKGEIPFFEPGLSEVVHRAHQGRRLTFDTAIDAAHKTSQVYFIAVGTPPLPDGKADVRAVHAAAQTICEVAETPAVVGIKSTVPVGTCDAIQALVDTAGKKHFVASIPEFLKEGSALADFMKPDRIILGVAHREAEKILRELYHPLQLSSDRVLVMDRRSSELSKYASNAMLATRISFMNEMARLCDTLGADIHAIRRAVGSDKRIGPSFLYAGPGYGGSCFPKDVSALAERSKEVGITLEVVEAAGRANKKQQSYIRDRVFSMLKDEAKNKIVAIWGVAFKAETDDVRETPALPVIQALIEAGCTVRIHDPEAAENFVKNYSLNVTIVNNEYEAAQDADLVVVMTDWRHFRNPDLEQLRNVMRTPAVFDARNLWTPFSLNSKGFHYQNVGSNLTDRTPDA